MLTSNFRRLLLVALACLVASSARSASADGPIPGHVDFDFLFGEWRVHHRRLIPGATGWVEFDGWATNRPALNGLGNIEEQILHSPKGTYRATAVRAFDRRSGEWAIWWLDGRYPAGPIDPPVKGRFRDGVGRFYSDYLQDGRPMRTRYTWSEITKASARWEQAESADGGKSWRPNWIMEFSRAPLPRMPPPDVPEAARGFDFLLGAWSVEHRYLVAADGKQTWREAKSVASNVSTLGGFGNIEEQRIQSPNGSYSALALRSFDPQTSQWSIWWLDGRSPHGPLDPPMRGAFENGIGTFYSDTTIDGQPTRIRFVWSQVQDAARWEQSYSHDAGRSWERNWTMDFRRRSPPRPTDTVPEQK